MNRHDIDEVAVQDLTWIVIAAPIIFVMLFRSFWIVMERHRALRMSLFRNL